MLNKNIKIEAVDYYCTETIAEYVVCLILAFERKFNSLNLGVKVLGEELYGKKAGIIGLGKIGFRTGQILKNSFECQIYYNSREDKKIPGYNFTSLELIFRNCDYIIISTKTRGSLENRKILKFLNKKNLIISICNDHVLPVKKILPYIGAKKIRGFISDRKYPNDKLISLYDNVWTFDHLGYFTEQSKKLKNHILNFLLKKYATKNSNSDFIYIIRHGETEWNKLGILQGSKDSKLTENGIKHAKDLSAKLQDKGIKYVFTSPLGRAKMTASIIAGQIGAQVLEVPEFSETNFGIFEGKKYESVKELFPEFFKMREENKYYKLYHPYPGGESYFDVYLRILKKAVWILANYENFVIVGHEGINRIIRGIIRQLSLEDMIYLRQKNNQLVTVNFRKGEETIETI